MGMMINFKQVKKNLIFNKKESLNYLNKRVFLKNSVKKNFFKLDKDYLSNLHVKKKIKDTFKPNLFQLTFLHKLILKFKRTTILELGVGWSTHVMSAALMENKIKYIKDIENLRFSNSFEIHSVDNYKKYIIKTKNILRGEQKKIVKFHYSKVDTTVYKKRICTEYRFLPHINPDLIFIDGPSQYETLGKVNNLSTGHPDYAPMSCDLLKIEPYLRPGTFVVIDGRTLNALFLKNFLFRNWDYFFYKEIDFHILFLNGPTLGKLNIKQLKFYNLS